MPAGGGVSAINVGINSAAAVTGAKQVNAALGSMIKQLDNVTAAINKMNAAASKSPSGGGGGGGGLGGAAKGLPEASGNLKEFMGILNRLRNTLFVVYLLREAFDGITDALTSTIKAGLKFNETMESAVIGTGGLIAQIGNLKREGVELKGLESIKVGMELAKKEVLALQLAGLQTAATSEALVTAFQQAVGPGLAAGLALKQVRDLTVDIVQVATSIGLPMHQISQEVRAIVEGSIDPNARVAKILQIDNKTIQKMKESGKLAEFLFAKLDKFREIGPIIEQSFAGAVSNVAELGQTLAGLATAPLFERIKTSLVDFNNAIRAGGAGQNAKALGEVFAPDIQKGIEAVSAEFDALGVVGDRVLDSLLDKARQVLAAFSTNPQAIKSVADSIDLVGDAVTQFIDSADAPKIVADVIGIVEAVARAIKDISDFFDELGRLLQFIRGWMKLSGDAALRWANIFVIARKAVFQSPSNYLSRDFKAFEFLKDIANQMQGLKEDWKGSIGEMQQAWNGVDPAPLESYFTRIRLASLDAANGIDYLSEQLRLMNGMNWQDVLDEKTKKTWAQIRRAAPAGSSVFQAQQLAAGKITEADIYKDISINVPPPPPKVDPHAGDKARRAAEKAEAEARAFQLAKLQRIEQVARDEVNYQDKVNKILLKQNEDLYEAKEITARQFVETKLRIETEGAEAEKKIALLRATQAVEITSETLKGMVPKDLAAQLQGGDQGLKDLEAALDAVQPKTQKQAEALREVTQAVIDLRVALLGVDVAKGKFDVKSLGEFKPFQQEEVTPTKEESLRAARALFAISETGLRRRLDLEEQILAVQKAETHGMITQAEASERIADLAEQKNQAEIAGLKYSLARAKAVYDLAETEALSLQILEKEAQVFRVTNTEAFFRGLNQNIDKLSDKFQQLGEDIRSIFRDAFEELGRTGFRGFADTFIKGIADALRTRAADSLSTIVSKIFTDIFRTQEGKSQSIFDGLIEKFLSIFGRAPTGKFSLGGIFEKLLGKLLDPLGRRAGAVGGAAGLPTAADKDVQLDEIPGVVDEKSLLTGINHDTTGILSKVTEMADSLRQMKECCAEHNSLLKQQMGASKGPGLLGQLLSAAAGAAAGGLVGGYFPTESTSVKVKDDRGTVPGGSNFQFGSHDFFPAPTGPAYTGGLLNPQGPPITTNITIQTPNPAAFNAQQTQQQISSMMYANLQKAQNLVPAINAPANAFNK